MDNMNSFILYMYIPEHSAQTPKHWHFSMVLFSGQPALSYDGTMHYSFDYAQQIHYPHYSQQVGPLCQCFGVCAEGSIHNVIVCAVWKILKIISSTWWTIRTALYCICTYQNLQLETTWQLHAHVACTMMTCLEGWLVTFNAYK
jgi:hypothetical protein